MLRYAIFLCFPCGLQLGCTPPEKAACEKAASAFTCDADFKKKEALIEACAKSFEKSDHVANLLPEFEKFTDCLEKEQKYCKWVKSKKLKHNALIGPALIKCGNPFK